MRGIITLLLSALVLLTVACSGTEKTPEISQTELISRINDNSAPVIVDVRTVTEYRRGHIVGAINIPYHNYPQLFGELKLSKGDEIVIYCETGEQSQTVAEYLQQQGFFEVRLLPEGMRGWRRAGLREE